MKILSKLCKNTGIKIITIEYLIALHPVHCCLVGLILLNSVNSVKKTFVLN